MAHYTIKELFDYWLETDGQTTDKTFLFSDYYKPPTDEEETDTRPLFVLPYVNAWYLTNKVPDSIISEKYSDYIFMVDSPDVATAYTRFTRTAIVYTITHNTEMLRVYDAMTTDFNPLDNYDRTEETTDNGSSTSGATSKTAPDDSETFYNVGSADSSGTTSNTRLSHIHGNIGVVDTVTLIKNTTGFFTENSMYDYLINAVINDSCFMVDYGNNAL